MQTIQKIGATILTFSLGWIVSAFFVMTPAMAQSSMVAAPNGRVPSPKPVPAPAPPPAANPPPPPPIEQTLKTGDSFVHFECSDKKEYALYKLDRQLAQLNAGDTVDFSEPHATDADPDYIFHVTRPVQVSAPAVERIDYTECLYVTITKL